MLKLHLRQQGFTYSACGLFTKREQNQKFREIGNLEHLYRKELGKAFFTHDASHSVVKI